MPEVPDAEDGTGPQRPAGSPPKPARTPAELVSLVLIALGVLLFLYVCVQVGGALR